MTAKRAALTAFLAFHLFAAVIWSMPLESPLLGAFRSWLRPYMLWSGLFQKWDMFAPDPIKLNSYIDAQVTFQDGSSRTWSFPRMESLGYLDRYSKERYRKYVNDYLRVDVNSRLWPDAARYVARVNHRSGSVPVSVVLVRHWSDVPPPGADRNNGLQWHEYPFFRYQVEGKDLL